jgi:glyoxylase-like metal-dependent hydrolase (beta-lactamase superfamily II)/rhodanese-related sulfurtransferase
MRIEQIYTGCLAQGTYYVESNGEVAIIDPLRETEPYLKKAKNQGAKIKYIFETHFHADFVSGHLDLSKKSGASIIYGEGAKPEFEFIEAKDGQEFKLGDVIIKALHTPGHTMESTTYLLIDENGIEKAIFSGDTLFIGDVGRPDLAQKGEITQEVLAGFLYDSLREKIMTLPDDVIVYPAHGAGSACGKNMSSETTDTLGHQKESNYALRTNMTKQEFIEEVTDGILPPPRYFAANVQMNKSGAKSLDDVLKKGNIPLDVETFEAMANHEGALVLDTRESQEFAKGHIPNSIFIGVDGNFAPWAGALIPDLQQPIIFVAEKGREAEVVKRLSRVGFDNTLGYLEGGFSTWKKNRKEIDFVESISAETFAEDIDRGGLNILDVRKPGEWALDHIENSENFPLDFINDEMNKLEKDKMYHLHCLGGYRSMIASSILKSRGYHKLIDIRGGYNDIVKTEIVRTSSV